MPRLLWDRLFKYYSLKQFHFHFVSYQASLLLLLSDSFLKSYTTIILSKLFSTISQVHCFDKIIYVILVYCLQLLWITENVGVSCPGCVYIGRNKFRLGCCSPCESPLCQRAPRSDIALDSDKAHCHRTWPHSKPERSAIGHDPQ